MNLIKKYIKKITNYILALTIAFWPSLLLAQEGGYGLEETANKAGLPGAGNTAATLPAIIGTMLSFLFGIVGTILVVLMIYGGFLWMTAGGEEKKVEDAKNIIKNAVIGIIIVFLSYGIAAFVINAIEKSTDAL